MPSSYTPVQVLQTKATRLAEEEAEAERLRPRRRQRNRWRWRRRGLRLPVHQSEQYAYGVGLEGFYFTADNDVWDVQYDSERAPVLPAGEPQWEDLGSRWEARRSAARPPAAPAAAAAR